MDPNNNNPFGQPQQQPQQAQPVQQHSAPPPDDEYGDILGYAKKNVNPLIWFTIFQATICRTSRTEVIDWEHVDPKPINPQTGMPVDKWVQRFDHLVCYIANVEHFKREFDGGRRISGLNLTLLSGKGLADKAILQLTWIESTLKRFLKVAPNLDFTKPVYISVFPTKQNGREGVGVSFKQGAGPNVEQWDKVPEFYSKENPNGMPAPIEDTLNDTWDFSAQNAFLGQSFFQNTYVQKVLPVAQKFNVLSRAQMEKLGIVPPAPVQQPQQTYVPQPVQPQHLQQPQFAQQPHPAAPMPVQVHQQPQQPQMVPPAMNDAWIEQRNQQLEQQQPQQPQQPQFAPAPVQAQQAPQQQQQAPPDMSGWANMDPTLQPPLGAPNPNDDDIPF